MTRDELHSVLKLIVAGDRRPIGDHEVAFWWGTIGDLDAGDAQAAVLEHFRTSDAWLKPVHVRSLVARARAARLEAGPGLDKLMAGIDPDAPDWAAQLRRRQEDVAAGRPVAALEQAGGGAR